MKRKQRGLPAKGKQGKQGKQARKRGSSSSSSASDASAAEAGESPGVASSSAAGAAVQEERGGWQEWQEGRRQAPGAEVLRLVSRYLSLAQLFVSQRVSRDWESGMQGAIGARSTLSFGAALVNGSRVPVSPLDTIVAHRVPASQAERMWRSLGQGMRRLRRIICPDCLPPHLLSGLRPLVARHAPDLRVLLLPHDPDPHLHLPHMPRLQQLRCLSLSSALALATPRLQLLQAYAPTSAAAIQRLNSADLTSLTLEHVSLHEVQLRDVCVGLSCLRKLIRLRLSFRSTAAADAEPLVRLFRWHLTRLQDLHLDLRSRSSLDLLVQRLVYRNLELRLLSLERVTLTDAALACLSRCECLATLRITSTAAILSRDALIALLEARAGHSLDHLYLRLRRPLDPLDLERRTLEALRRRPFTCFSLGTATPDDDSRSSEEDSHSSSSSSASPPAPDAPADDDGSSDDS